MEINANKSEGLLNQDKALFCILTGNVFIREYPAINRRLTYKVRVKVRVRHS